MLFNKKFILLAIFFVSLLTISVVSAEENSTDDVVGIEQNAIDENLVESIENQDSIGTDDKDSLSVSKEDTLTASQGTFKDLSNLINNAPSNSVLILDKDYRYEDTGVGTGIDVAKVITIDGKGHIIDGASISRGFKINAEGVILKNIIFKNCFSTGSGGSIYWSANNGVLTNCKFINSLVKSSSSSTYGGAVYWSGAKGVMSDCEFNNCYSNRYGSSSSHAYSGAVYWYGSNGAMNNCKFTDCVSRAESYSYYSSDSFAYSYGGALYWRGSNGAMVGCDFTKCYADAIEKYGSGSNIGDGYGAAVYWYGYDGFIDKCSFIDNSKYEDGVVYIAGNNVEIISSVVLNNPRNGIYWTGSGGKISNSILRSSSTYYVIYSSEYNVNANYNWWGNTIDDYMVKKNLPSKIQFTNWLYLDVIVDKTSLEVGETAKIKVNFNNLVSNDVVSQYKNSKLATAKFTISDETGVRTASIYNGAGEIGYVAKSTPSDWAVLELSQFKKTFNFNVKKGHSKIVASNLKTVYNGGKYLTITLKDKYGHVIKGAKVSVKIKGKAKTYITDLYGKIKVSTDGLNPKKYKAVIKFGGDANYFKASDKKVKITVKKAKPKVKVKPKVFDVKSKNKILKITLKDKKGVIKKQKLTLAINGKKYSAKTNKKGIAKFNLKKIKKVGKYKGTIKFKGNKKYKSLTKNVKIKVKKYKKPKYKVITANARGYDITTKSGKYEVYTRIWDMFLMTVGKFKYIDTTLFKKGKQVKNTKYSVKYYYNGKWTGWKKDGIISTAHHRHFAPDNVNEAKVKVKFKV